MSRAHGSPLAAVAGTVAPGFEPVREAFAEAVASQHPATGAALAATHDGRLVVDLWAGATNAAGMPWQEDTLCVLFSGTKGLVASAMLWLADRRELRLTDRVSDHWIEFGASGKADITVAQLCAHAAGLPWIDQALDAGERGDLPRLAALLAAQGPVVEVGRPCYHAITFGWLTDGLARRVHGRPIAELVDEVLAAPLGLDLRIGLGDDASAAGRVARLHRSEGYEMSALVGSRSRPPARPRLRQPAAGRQHRGRLVAAVAGAGRQRPCHRAGGGRAVRRTGDRAGGGHADAGAGAGAGRRGRRPAVGAAASVRADRLRAAGHAQPAGAAGGRVRAHGSGRLQPRWLAASFGPGSRSSPPRCETRTATAARPRCWTCCTGACMAERPNVLLVMADQLGACHLPCYGHPLVQAPNLSRLAEQGAVFERAYCASPLCAPSRAAMLTGRLPSQTGVYDNAAELPAATPTIVHLLRAAGYATALTGKMHFVGPDQLHGFEQRLTSDVYPAGFDWTPDWRLESGARLHWYHTMTSLQETAVTEAATQTDYDDEVAFTGCQLLRDLSRQPHRRPFFATVSFTNPHDPWEVRRRHWQLYDDDAIDLPAVPAIPREQADPHSLRLRDMIGSDRRPLDEAELRRARHGYYAAISYLDERIGELLSVLEDTGLAEDTMVVFTSDHGEMLGERGLWYKMTFFDPSARVPLIVRGPGVAPGRRAGCVSQLDLAPTLAELAGVDGADGDGFTGSSLAGMLAGGDAGPDLALGEYLAEGVRTPEVMVRRGRHKYLHARGDPDRLYDLEADPDEVDNLAELPQHAELAAGFRDEVARRWDLDRLEREVLDSQRRRRVVAEALARGAHTPWDFQPHTDASLQWVRGDAAANTRPSQLRPRGGLPEE